MPLLNRVDPFGVIHAVAERGLFTGNRGVIHDPTTRTLLRRRWTTRAWIICALDHPRGVRREAMGRNAPSGNAGWTELFFLDEVTALAAGHRPCFYCRREAAIAFAVAFGGRRSGRAASAPAMDAILHRQRSAVSGATVALSPADVAALPDGAMVARDGHAFATRGGRLLPWSFAGYAAVVTAPPSTSGSLRLLTPPATIATLAAGYRPIWHASADG